MLAYHYHDYQKSGRLLIPASPASTAEAYLLRACEYVKTLTHATPEDAIALHIGDAFRAAVAAVADEMYLMDGAAGKTHESVGGYSVSYEAKDNDRRLYAAARMYLSQSGLLYGGCGS